MNIEKIGKERLLDGFFESEKLRFPNLIPVGIGIGICLYFSLENEPIFWINAAIFLLLLIVSCIFNRYEAAPYIAKFSIFAIFFISLGFFISQVRTNYVNTFMLSMAIERPISFSATVESCEKTEKGLKFIVHDVKTRYRGKIKELCEKFNKLSLTWIGNKARTEPRDYTPGSRVLFFGKLSPISQLGFPGAFDFKKQQYFKGISARGFIMNPPRILNKNTESDFWTYVEQIRHKIGKKIEERLTTDVAAVVKALSTGNKSGISQEIRTIFVNSGIAHILAISGLHMGIIGFFIFWLSRIILCCCLRIAMFYDIKKVAAIISWIFTIAYLFISGCSVPSVRAFIMHTLVMTAILINRTALTMRSVAVAASMIMLTTPEAILFPSFQMSFGAVMAIVAFYEDKPKLPNFLNRLWEIVATTVVASIPTTIISISTFNQLTLNSIFANIVSIPLMSFIIMPLIVIALFFMIFDLSKPIILAAGYGVELLIKIANETSKLPGSFFVIATPTSYVFGIVIVSGIWLMLIKHRIRLIGVFGIAAGVISYFFQSLPDIFISPHAKVVGIRTDDAVCFNHLGYFKAITGSWAKSVGFSNRENYKSDACRKIISQIDEDTRLADVKGKKIIITSSDDQQEDADLVIRLNEEENKFSELIYLDKNMRVSTEKIHRPWS